MRRQRVLMLKSSLAAQAGPYVAFELERLGRIGPSQLQELWDLGSCVGGFRTACENDPATHQSWQQRSISSSTPHPRRKLPLSKQTRIL